MRNSKLLNAVFVAGLAVMAQDACAQTMDGQMQMMQHRQEAAPSYDNSGYIDSTGSGAIPALPLEVMTNGSVTYINGGIGDEEIAELKSKKHEFNLYVMMTGPSGEFISDVSMRILDSSGAPLVAIDNAGPYTYVKLPAGSYTLQASSPQDSNAKNLKITIPAGGTSKQHLTFSESGGVTTKHQPTATID